MKIQFCPYCGTKLDDGARFCKNCGECVVQEQQSVGGTSAHTNSKAEASQPKSEPVKEDPRTKRKTGIVKICAVEKSHKSEKKR